MFFITTVKIKEKFIIRSRTVGYFKNFEDADIRLKENTFDLYECGYYDYAIIEELHEGFYPIDDKPKWYKWDDEKQGFFPCEVPSGFVHSVGFSIG